MSKEPISAPGTSTSAHTSKPGGAGGFACRAQPPSCKIPPVLKSPLVFLAASAALLANGATLQLSPAADSVLEIRGNQKQALLRFDLHTIPADVTVLSARLLLTLQTSSDPPIPPKRFALAE